MSHPPRETDLPTRPSASQWLPRDTSKEAAALQEEFYAKLTGAQRVDIAVEMSILAREFAMSRIRAEHPDLGERELVLEYIRSVLGIDV